jgi:succinate-acetate transporter protein
MASTEPSVPDTIADPGPLGLAGFAATTLVLSFVNAGLINAAAVSAVLALALFYGGLGQLIAGLFDFRKGNTFGATAFCTYGGFWLAFAFYGWFFEKDAIAAGADGVTTGMFLLVFTIVTAYLALASLRTSGALVAVFVFLFLTFLFLTIGALAGTKMISEIGGYLGIVTAILAFYTSAAGVTNATWKRVVLPVFPLAPGTAAVRA